MIDLTKPLMLRDGTPVLVTQSDEDWFDAPTFDTELVQPDPARVGPGLFGWRDGRNSSHSFYRSSGKHVFGKDFVVNQIDWSQPIELDDGTPLIVVPGNDDYHVEIRRVKPGPHPAFPLEPINGGSARRACGLVQSNHKYHVRNRVMTKLIDTTKVLFARNNHGVVQVTFVTETSDGNILIDMKPNPNMEAGWMIFDQQGKMVRSHNGRGTGVTLENAPEEIVLYQNIAQVQKGYIMASAYGSETEARRSGKQVVRVTSKGGRVVAVELLA